MSPSSKEQLSILFPAPLPPPSHTPTRVFGISSQSTDVLLKLLKENHEKFHIFFNARGMHNHLSHHLLAIYALGATGKVIEAANGYTGGQQLPAFESPISITEENFFDHLGKGDNYNAYLKYFTQMLSQEKVDFGDILEKYIFSEKFNFDKTRKDAGKPQPEMLNRFLAGLLHPMIHAGYGVEFGLGGILAEGLAQTAVHRDEASVLVPASFFNFEEQISAISHITSALPKLDLQRSPGEGRSEASKYSGHLLSIVARILKDQRLNPAKLNLASGDLVVRFNAVLSQGGEIIREYVDQWDLHLSGDATSDAAILDTKVEEIFWAHVLMYGVGGWSEKVFLADFVNMHLVTSAIFISNLVATLKKSSSKTTLLKAYVALSLAWWVSRGRPGFAISKFYEATGGFNPDDAAHFDIPGPHPTPNEKTLKSGDSSSLSPNPWYNILQTTLVHPNEHLCKLQRALAHADTLYGSRAAGRFAHLKVLSEFEANAGFEGIEKLDGSLFLRSARLTADRLGWMREGQEYHGWDFDGFA
ncbi:hypothetical protein SCHPADRAFT_839823 [Schizopora paradoxa]|uniref:Uncharacterized protein n=1 Tax=Schizopora paradoxa TaxID=27342 RepID=A0A0H2R6E8_9AGAM|nr:hypothetical protein SCHPADRAFT_839823 [Schizopora paradoxa]